MARRAAENYERLCEALRALGCPRLRIEGVQDDAAADLSRQLLHRDFFARTEASTWRTDHGSIDILASIPGRGGEPADYQALRERATLTPTGGVRIPVASLDDVIASKTYADRAKDRAALPELRALRRRIDGDLEG